MEIAAVVEVAISTEEIGITEIGIMGGPGVAMAAM
jgi:hypothetical protein